MQFNWPFKIIFDDFYIMLIHIVFIFFLRHMVYMYWCVFYALNRCTFHLTKKNLSEMFEKSSENSDFIRTASLLGDLFNMINLAALIVNHNGLWSV